MSIRRCQTVMKWQGRGWSWSLRGKKLRWLVQAHHDGDVRPCAVERIKSGRTRHFLHSSNHHLDRTKWGQTRLAGGKNGVKHSVLTEGKGVPMAVAISGANTHDVKLLEETLGSIVIFRPLPSLEKPQNLCLVNRSRKLLVRFEKKAENYLALVQFTRALIAWRKIISVHQL